MQTLIENFFRDRLDRAKPVLLGISGGPDSLALLHLMVEYRRRITFNFGIAHIDHGWRQESREEAALLEKLAVFLNVPFHLKILTPQLVAEDGADSEKNLEAYCRLQRIAFFTELCRSHGYQAVVLAHHADDLAETVLKRIFEGASFPNLVGMTKETSWGNLLVWRPLLSVSKKELIKFADRFTLKPFDDKTNLDARFLRGRMRTTLIPELSRIFGKEIASPLIKLSRDATEWRDYIHERVLPVLRQVELGPFGFFLDVLHAHVRSLVELKYIVGYLSHQAGFILPASLIHKAAEIALRGIANKFVRVGGGTLFLDRGRIFVVRGDLFDIEAWTVVTNKVRYEGQVSTCGWKNVWRGAVDVYLPLADYRISVGEAQKNYPRSSPLSKLWTDAKVPAFLRTRVPVIWEGEGIAHEFLSGQTFHKLDLGSEVLHISLKVYTEHDSKRGFLVLKKPCG